MRFATTASCFLSCFAALLAPASAGLIAIEYDLAPSVYKVRDTPFGGAGNGDFPIAGGRAIIAFPESGGAIAPGPARLVSFEYTLNFRSGNSFASVLTDLLLRGEYGPENPATGGRFAANVLTWEQEVPYRATGSVTCSGVACGIAGFPNGTPVPVNDLTPFRFNPFTFTPGGGSFTSPDVEVPDTDPNARTLVQLAGTEISRRLVHNGDHDRDGRISLSELLRGIQLFTAAEISCSPVTEDGFAPVPGNRDCPPHALDYGPQDWIISIAEILRLVQFYNLQGYTTCPEANTEDGWCPINPL
jgi:hypothetical protein